MNGVRFFMFIVLIPALVALGHDIYLFVIDGHVDQFPEVITDGERPIKSFFASLGWIWTNYHPESYKWTVQNVSAEDWALINSVLSKKAVVLGLGFAGFFYAILGVFKILGVWPFRKEDKSDKRDLISGKKPQRMKYKKK